MVKKKKIKEKKKKKTFFFFFFFFWLKCEKSQIMSKVLVTPKSRTSFDASVAKQPPTVLTKECDKGMYENHKVWKWKVYQKTSQMKESNVFNSSSFLFFLGRGGSQRRCPFSQACREAFGSRACPSPPHWQHDLNYETMLPSIQLHQPSTKETWWSTYAHEGRGAKGKDGGLSQNLGDQSDFSDVSL